MSALLDPLTSVLDELLPAHGEVAAAGALGLAERVREDAGRVAPLKAALDELLEALPRDFALAGSARRVETLHALEDERPRAFAGLINLAYNAYYTDPAVLRQIEAATGYVAAAPQPRGYDLPPFDESALAFQRTRVPGWRRV